MKIKLTQNQEALFDDEDFDLVAPFNWFAHKVHGLYYACAKAKTINGYRKQLRMHRIILGIDDPKIHIDHIDHNGVNNHRANLRICTYQQNSMNRRGNKNTSSTYKGVSVFINDYGKLKITSHIQVNGKLKHLGYYNTEEEAALAYNEAAKNYFGEFAYINIIE